MTDSPKIPGGWVKVYRVLTDHDLWLAEPFTRGQAWVDLLLLANRKEGFIRRRGIRITVKRGQAGWAQDKLAERWHWSKNKVRRFLDELKKDGRITLETALKNIAVTTLITIANYEQYQGNGTEDETENGTKDGPKTKQKTAPEQEVKEEKEVKTIHRPEAGLVGVGQDSYLSKKKRKLTGRRLETFLQFWEAFNYKHAKAEAADAWLDIPQPNDMIVEDIIKAAKTEAARRPGLIAEKKTPIYPQGWLSGRRWEDEIYQHPTVPPNTETEDHLRKIGAIA